MIDPKGWSKWIVPAQELIKSRSIPLGDLQMHTVWTDGRPTIQDYVTTAQELRLQAIAITEHVGYESAWFPDFVNEVEIIRNPELPLELYHGAEVSVWDYDGTLKTSDEILEQAEIVIGVVHRYPNPRGGLLSFDGLGREEALELELRASESITQNKRVDIWGHPGGTFFRKFGAFDVGLLAPAIRNAKAHDIVVEINAKYIWDMAGFFELLQEINPMVSIGSDAHGVEELARTHNALTQFFKDSYGDSDGA